MLCLTACEDLDAAEMSVMRDKRGFKCEQCPEGMEGDGTTCHGEYTSTCIFEANCQHSNAHTQLRCLALVP